MKRVGFLFVGVAAALVASASLMASLDLFGRSAAEFEQNWEERGFPLISPTEYEAIERDGRVVVTGRARDANRGLARRLKVEEPTEIKLSWAWRVRSALAGEIDERTKGGDDFAARVFVVFETSVVPTRTRAINYVWSAKESPGEVFPSPYTGRVAHIVMRNNQSVEESEEWFSESRDVLQDYRNFFGESPSVVTAVAIMVDTDNTDGYAEADFRDLVLEISPAPEVSG